MVLCNQGCGTHVVFVNGKPYNQDRKTPHSETCLSLRFGKFWGGKFNTIPMSYIINQINGAYHACSEANKTRNIDEILRVLHLTVDNLQFVIHAMDNQSERNAKWNEEFEEYKTNLVKDQRDRDRKDKQYDDSSHPHFVRGDELE
jgi:hypothetical protein